MGLVLPARKIAIMSGLAGAWNVIPARVKCVFGAIVKDIFPSALFH